MKADDPVAAAETGRTPEPGAVGNPSDEPGGVRPSSGAAMCEGLTASECSKVIVPSHVSAPGDGRTPVYESERSSDPLTQPSNLNSQPPPSVPDHELLCRIGQGSYGDVWLARNKLGTLRAVKIVYRQRFEDQRPFDREFKGIQKFEPISRSHEGLVDILQVGGTAEYFYYVMELADDAQESGGRRQESSDSRQADGSLRASDFAPSDSRLLSPASYSPRTLRSEQQRLGRLPVPQCVEIGLALSSALAHLHAQGLVHRDVKPSNIIFVGGIAKLADIGLVAEASEARSFVGTEGFIPPEGPGTPQADLYSLGKLLYEISTGQDRRNYPSLPAHAGEIAVDDALLELNAVILKACDYDVHQRYQSAQKLESDLVLLRRGDSVRRTHRVAQRWRRAGRAATWLTAGAAGLGLILVVRPVRPPPNVPRAEKLSTNDLANQYYQLGRIYFDKLSGTNFQAAVTNFDLAIKADPSFAQAYARLAEAYSWSDGQWNPGWKYFPKAKQLAFEALKLDGSLAEPHYVLGCYHAMMEWNWTEAQKECKRAIQLNPSAASYLGYAEVLRIMGRTNEALGQVVQAQRLDPRSLTINIRMVGYLADARRFEEALKHLNQVMALDFTIAASWMAWQQQYCLCALGRYREAIQSEWKWRTAAGEPADQIELELGELSRTSESELSRAYWRRQVVMAAKEYPGSFWEACLYAQLLETERAIAGLQALFARRDTWTTFRIMTDWRLDPVRADPRFRAIVKAMRLE